MTHASKARAEDALSDFVATVRKLAKDHGIFALVLGAEAETSEPTREPISSIAIDGDRTGTLALGCQIYGAARAANEDMIAEITRDGRRLYRAAQEVT